MIQEFQYIYKDIYNAFELRNKSGNWNKKTCIIMLKHIFNDLFGLNFDDSRCEIKTNDGKRKRGSKFTLLIPNYYKYRLINSDSS
jgi:hypothetical protein